MYAAHQILCSLKAAHATPAAYAADTKPLYSTLGAYSSRAANASTAAGHPGSTDSTLACAAKTFAGQTCRPKACMSSKDLSNTFIFFSRSTCNWRQMLLHAPRIQYTYAYTCTCTCT